MTETFAVIDFETNGDMPQNGGRPTEIAAVLVRDGIIVDRYQSLMNAGVYVPYFIEELTGISNEMLRTGPPSAHDMADALDFVGTAKPDAHNASFDKMFWNDEHARLHRRRNVVLACTGRP